MWQDLFDIYKSVQSGDGVVSQQPANDSLISKATEQKTLYVFAYLDDGTGKTLRSIPVKDRLTLLEAKQQALESRLAELEAALQDALEENEDDN
jgi:hypothetical protein